MSLGRFPAWDGFRAVLRDGALDPGRESVLAMARAFLAATGLVAVYLDPVEPARYASLAYGLLTAYLVFALTAVVGVGRSRRLGTAVPLVIHATDLLFAGAVTLVTEGPNSPFFFLLTFALIAAAFRWGLRATVATAAGGILLIAIETAVIEPVLGRGQVGVEGRVDVNRIVIRSGYLLIAGTVLGYLGEAKNRLHAEALTIAHLLGLVRVGAGLRSTVREVLDALLRLTGAGAAVVVARERTTGRLLRWELDSRSSHGLTFSEPGVESTPPYMASDPDSAWYASCAGGKDGPPLEFEVIGHPGDGAAATVAGLAAAHPCRSLLSAPLRFGEDWDGRLFLIDCAAGAARTDAIRFVQRVTAPLGPAAYSVYLLHRVRRQAEALERARLARDLHDGTTQTLISVEMQLGVLGRRAATEAPALAVELERIRAAVKEEVLQLRDLLSEVRSHHARPGELLAHLAAAVDRFQRDTGIAARFWSNLEQDELGLGPGACREIAQIVNEALVNVRRHSGAGRVRVSLTRADGRLHLSIDDDGRGFPFSGRLSHDELDGRHAGPHVIKERVRAMGGALTIESKPGDGARLEVVLP